MLQNLTRAGFVVSHRGNTGGFELEELHRSASVLEVVEAVEGPIRLNICLTSDHACTRQGWCPAHCSLGQRPGSDAQVLQEASISNLAEQAAAARRPVVFGIDEVRWN